MSLCSEYLPLVLNAQNRASPQTKDTLQTIAAGHIHMERNWRAPQTFPGRMATEQTGPEYRTSCAGYVTVAIAMRKTNLRLSACETVFHDGIVLLGMVHVATPTQSLAAIFRTPCEFMHIYISDALFRECFLQMKGQAAPDELALETSFFKDSMIEQLALNLYAMELSSPAEGNLYLHGIALAITARIIATRCGRVEVGTKPKISPLSNWRLKRATDYIDANLAGCVPLADLAATTGLTRMYFAAQFRAATGLRPHEYVLRRRIERAQEMLMTPGTTLLDATFEAGFQTQAHFTTVFKKYTGQTPNRWRQSNFRHKTETRLPAHVETRDMMPLPGRGPYENPVTAVARHGFPAAI
jgi:AraC family transcriptional regulator